MAGFLWHLVQRTMTASPSLTPRFAAPYERMQRDVQPLDAPSDPAGGEWQPSQDPPRSAARRNAARPEIEAFAQPVSQAWPDWRTEPQTLPAAVSMPSAVLAEPLAAARLVPSLAAAEVAAPVPVQVARPVPPAKGRRKTAPPHGLAPLDVPAPRPEDLALPGSALLLPGTALLAEPPPPLGFSAPPDAHRQGHGRDEPLPDETLEHDARAKASDSDSHAPAPTLSWQPSPREARSATLPMPRQPSSTGLLREPRFPTPMPAQPLPASDAFAPEEPALGRAPTVHVTIGRVELRAAASAPPPPGARPAGTRPALSLNDYLARRSNGARR